MLPKFYNSAACFMQVLLNCHSVTEICTHFFTLKVNLGYEDFYVIFLKTYYLNKVQQPIMRISHSFSLKIHFLHIKGPFSMSGEMSQRDIMT